MPSLRPSALAKTAAGCVFFVGVTVLLGWMFDITMLKSILPIWPKMSPNTMLAFLLAAVSLWCATSEQQNKSAKSLQKMFLRLSQGCGVAVVVIGSYRLCAYMFGWNLNFDMLGFHEVLAAGESPARMAQTTALGVVLIGGALYFTRPSRSIFIFLFFVLASALVGCLGLLRYIYGGEPLLPYSQMSAIAAICFLLLSIGTFCSRTDSGLMALLLGDSAGSLLARRLLLPALIIPFAIGWFRLKAQQAGWFGTEAGLSLFALSNVIVFGALIWITANLLHRTDSKRKQEEAEKRASETRYRTLFDRLIEGFCTIEVIFDTNGKAVDYRILEVNPAFERQSGLHDAQGKLIRDFAPDLEESWFELFGKVALTGEAVQFENEAKALGRYYDVHAYQVGEPESRKVAVLFNDITERKRTEQVLRESEEYFHFLSDLSDETRMLAKSEEIMAVTARMLGEHLHVSRCAYADVEQDGEQFSILHDYTDGCASTVGNYQLSRFGEWAATTVRSGKTLIIRDVDTELSEVEGVEMFNVIGIKALICCPLIKDGVLRAMMAVHQTTPRDWLPNEIAIVQDVVERCWATIERRTAEEKLHLLNVELEQRVAQRTIELETINKELEAFSYSVSHDLRAPLRAIDGFSKVVLEDYSNQLDEQGKNYLDRVRAATQRMGQLIDDMLVLSRITRAKMRRETVNLSAVANEVLEEFQKDQPESKVNWQVESKLLTEGDPQLLRIVMTNLLGNAWKYTGKNSVAKIEFGAIVNSDGTREFYVRDNGAGFDMAYADRLFGAFQRLHTSTEFPGTGIGLATVQRIIHRHGGKIRGDGVPNQGATFYFSLQ